MSPIAFKILSPKEAKKHAKAHVAEWLRQKEVEEKKARLEAGRKAREQDAGHRTHDPKHKTRSPLTEPTSRIDWPNLDLDKVETLVTIKQGVPAWEAIEQANQQGKIIIPNCVHDRMLVETQHWQKNDIKAGYGSWTGTSIIFEAPDRAFEDKVVYNWEDNKIQYSISVTIPRHFKGKKNCALIVEHPDFEVGSLGNNSYELKIADESKIHFLENFPRENQKWYNFDERFGIPVGNPLDAQQVDNTMRYLWRVAGSYCGLLVRIYDGDGDRHQYVYAFYWPSLGLGVHVIDLKEVAPKK